MTPLDPIRARYKQLATKRGTPHALLAELKAMAREAAQRRSERRKQSVSDTPESWPRSSDSLGGTR